MTWLQRNVRPEQIRELSLFLLIVLAVLIFGSLIEQLLHLAHLRAHLDQRRGHRRSWAIGQTLVVLTRNIDLSVGSIVGLLGLFRSAR